MAETTAPTDRILVGKSDHLEYLLLKLANRHGLVAGATGTGKTVTLQVLAEGLANAGVSVFAADIKGDLSGIAAAGQGKDVFVKRAAEIGIEYQPDRFPVVFWDVFGEQGHPIRATVSEMGPLLLARLLELNDTQEGVLNVAFKVADDNGWPVVDLKDLRALLQFVGDNAAEIGAKYGNVAKTSLAAIQRQLLMLENQGADSFLGEPALDLNDFLRTDRDGRGFVNILAADKLMAKPRLYATFLVWMLSELFETLPEVGDLAKPKLVFFFDEAHLLFNDAPKPLLDAVQQVVRLIRSKGVGVYFVTQNPLDVPEEVLGQLGNKVQHALRAFTPRDQKAVRAAAETFRQRPGLDTSKVIMELAVGEALISLLEEGGVPGMVDRALVAPPTARVGPLTAEERAAVIAASPLRGKYDQVLDRESAYELLAKRRDMPEEPAQAATQSGGLGGILGRITETLASSGIPVGSPGGGSASAGAAPAGGKAKAGGRQPMSLTELVIRSAAQSFARSASTQIAREGGKILRNSLGGIIGGAIGDAIGGGGSGGRGRRTRAVGSSGVPRAGSSDFAGEMSDLLGGAKPPRR
jgi:DNA helicase HerA-like ATPase